MSVHLVTPETAEVINLEPLEPVVVRILEDGTRTGHRAGLIEGLLPPACPGPPQHIHREHDEMFFVAGRRRKRESTSALPQVVDDQDLVTEEPFCSSAEHVFASPPAGTNRGPTETAVK